LIFTSKTIKVLEHFCLKRCFCMVKYPQWLELLKSECGSTKISTTSLEAFGPGKRTFFSKNVYFLIFYDKPAHKLNNSKQKVELGRTEKYDCKENILKSLYKKKYLPRFLLWNFSRTHNPEPSRVPLYTNTKARETVILQTTSLKNSSAKPD